MCDTSQGGAQSPLGGMQGTQAPDLGNPSLSMPSTLGQNPAQPKKPGKTFGQRALGGVQGAVRGYQAGTQMQNAMSPQRGMGYRPQMQSSQEFGQGPLSGGMMDDYLRTQLATRGITY